MPAPNGGDCASERMRVPADELHGTARNFVLHRAYDFPALALLIDLAWALVEHGLGGIVVTGIHALRLRPKTSAPWRLPATARSLSSTWAKPMILTITAAPSRLGSRFPLGHNRLREVRARYPRRRRAVNGISCCLPRRFSTFTLKRIGNASQRHIPLLQRWPQGRLAVRDVS